MPHIGNSIQLNSVSHSLLIEYKENGEPPPPSLSMMMMTKKQLSSSSLFINACNNKGVKEGETGVAYRGVVRPRMTMATSASFYSK